MNLNKSFEHGLVLSPFLLFLYTHILLTLKVYPTSFDDQIIRTHAAIVNAIHPARCDTGV